MELQIIQKKISEIRGQKVMLDFDLAELYEVETKRLKEAVKRNIDRFPDDFMFELTKDEFENLRTQIATSSWGGSRYMPFAFTEQGVTMLASVLNSKKAVQMSITIVRAFITLRKFVLNYTELAIQIKELKDSNTHHSKQLNEIYKVLELLLTDKQNQTDFENRNRIGFKK